ncbi:MAG: right-handed parallel beta-helix repeat-containing protein [Prolixibacteraceae bacterium]|nr:right-handed parallel beta-helix repeat-containing protein [Prolixibacteraceae bacterium]MBN2775470.1 right-handed parallel beta-helix repeat-containing protein [Prolixibacteraceae bacterium]
MKYLLSIVFLFTVFSLKAKSLYVSVDGNDLNSGEEIENPLKTITKAISLINPGDIIYVRGGVHSYSSTISISKNGTESDTCFLMAYPGERPILDFSGTAFGKKGISLTGNYWYIKGFDIRYAGDNGMNISGGGNNIIEFCSFYENKDTGLQLGNGAHDNTIVNCDSYYNADPPDYGDADGFAPKLDVGSNNRFIGCRSWGNCDDGWDGYMRGATNVTTILENCWTWGNGYLKDGTNPGSQANGNGFKMGGGDNSNSQNLTHHFYLTNCMSFSNKAKGFDQNNNVGTMYMLNCTGFGNGSSNFRIKKELVGENELIVKNCVSYEGKVELGSFAIQETNSWMPPFYVDESDFITIDTSGVSAPRKEDGSLPDVDFIHLSEGSDLIDAGTNIGLPFSGSAPDLGAFETEIIQSNSIEIKEDFVQVYFSDEYLYIKNRNSERLPLHIKLFNINGQLVFEKESGSVDCKINTQEISSGLYLLTLSTSDWLFSRKLVK